MEVLRKIANGIDRTENIFIWLAATIIFLMIVFIVIETLSRYLFRAPITEAIELAEYTLAFATALALAFTQKVRGHVAVGFLETKLSPRARGKVSAVFLPVYLAVVVFITWAAFRLMYLSITEWRLSWTMKVPMFIPESIIFIGFVLLGLQVTVDMFRAFSAVRRGEEYRMTKGE